MIANARPASSAGWTRDSSNRWVSVGTAISEAERDMRKAAFVDLCIEAAKRQGYPDCVPLLDRIERILWPAVDHVVSDRDDTVRAGAT